jgi:hypothetical protein
MILGCMYQNVVVVVHLKQDYFLDIHLQAIVYLTSLTVIHKLLIVKIQNITVV